MKRLTGGSLLSSRMKPAVAVGSAASTACLAAGSGFEHAATAVAMASDNNSIFGVFKGMRLRQGGSGKGQRCKCAASRDCSECSGNWRVPQVMPAGPASVR